MTPTTVPVIFDLDGTLVDPAGGITDGIAAAGLFHTIRGSAADEAAAPGAPSGKASIVAAALADLTARHGEDARRAVMVGDRNQDVAGAAANGLACLGVGWGFAPDGELHAAGAVEVVHTTLALHATITRLSECPGTEALNEVHTIGNV